METWIVVLCGWLRKAMAIRVEDQLETIRDVELRVDRADMVADSVIADEEALGNLVVLESLTHQVQHFALPMGERRDLRLLGIRFLGQLSRPYVAEHTTHDSAFEPRLASLDLLDGLDEHLGGLILEQHAQRAAAHGVPVGRGITNPGEDEYAGLPGDRQQIRENIKAVLARHIQVQQDDIGLLTRGQPDRRNQVAE